MKHKKHWFNITYSDGRLTASIQIGYNNNLINLNRLDKARRNYLHPSAMVTSVSYLGYMRPELMKFIKEKESDSE